MRPTGKTVVASGQDSRASDALAGSHRYEEPTFRFLAAAAIAIAVAGPKAARPGAVIDAPMSCRQLR
jgi:hypothetical protein